MGSPKDPIKRSEWLSKLSQLKKGKTGELHNCFGTHRTEEQRKKISDSRKGKCFSETHKKNLSLAETGNKNYNYGKEMSLDQRQKISNAHKGKIVSDTTKQKLREIQTGKKHTEIALKKMSNSQRGHPTSQTTRKKISEAQTGRNGYWFGKKHSDAQLLRHLETVIGGIWYGNVRYNNNLQ